MQSDRTNITRSLLASPLARGFVRARRNSIAILEHVHSHRPRDVNCARCLTTPLSSLGVTAVPQYISVERGERTKILPPRVWFITGTSTGVGRAVAEIALQKGDIVVATARRTSSLDDLAQQHSKERLLVLPLDVTQQDQVVTAFAEAKRTFGRIDVVFNNAGFGHVGEFEAIEETAARFLFETNFWGAVSVTKEAVKCFREINPLGTGGRLLQMSSYGGLVGVAGSGFYGASKFALEGASESLAAELDPAWNIKVTIIEPGWVRTELFDNATWSPEHPAYDNPSLLLTHVRRFGWGEGIAWKDARRTAEALHKISEVPNPPLNFVVGKDAIEIARKKILELSADIDTYEALSEGLEE